MKSQRKYFINEDVEKVNFYESSIMEVNFSQYPIILSLTIDWSEGDPIVMEFQNCKDIKIELRENSVLKDTCKIKKCFNLEIHGFLYKKVDDGYTVQLNFCHEPKGFIRIKCDSFRVVTTSEPITNGGQANSIYEDK